MTRLLARSGVREVRTPRHVSVKAPIFPFKKLRQVDFVLGPEMRSTGEVMGIDVNMGLSFAKSQIGAGNRVPTNGTVFLSLNDRDKRKMNSLGKDLAELGFKLMATKGTAAALESQGLSVETVFKVGEDRPNIVDRMINGDVDWIINTPLGPESKYDERLIRRTALERGLPTMTTVAAAHAAVLAIRALREDKPAVCSLQEYHARLRRENG